MEQDLTLHEARMNLFNVVERTNSISELRDIQRLIAAYYAQKATEGMDKLWEQGAWNAEKNESILHEHLRTPYKYAK